MGQGLRPNGSRDEELANHFNYLWLGAINMVCEIDILLKNVRVIDPIHGVDDVRDIAVAGGKVVEIAESIPPRSARDVHRLEGYVAVPGIIDSHVHASALTGGVCAHKMMARAGVTTALEMAGPVDSVWRIMATHGAGLNIACIHAVAPGFSVADQSPSSQDLQTLFDEVTGKGAIGFKVLGGHFPLTPEATLRSMEVAERNRGYFAIHAGTTETGSNFKGFLEAVELGRGKKLHIAHINSYCRGTEDSAVNEAILAAKTLEENPNLFSESYLSPLNGTSGRMMDDLPVSKATALCLERFNMEPSYNGMKHAIEEGIAQVIVQEGGEMVLKKGPGAVKIWEDAATDLMVSFDINPAETCFFLAMAKKGDGNFSVDAISTDGGGLPRNVIVESGLALVAFKALSLRDFVIKTSIQPAQMLGLTGKGSLGVGADADITVLDTVRNKAVMSLSSGKIIMYRGHVIGSRGKALTLTQGKAYVESIGLDFETINPERFFQRESYK